MASTDLTMKEGDHVLLRRNKSSRVFRVKLKRQLFFEKAKFTLDGIIGHPFGSTFEVRNGEMIKLENTTEAEENADGQEEYSGKDNRNLIASDANQKLTQEDIEKMKQEGVSGEKIIEELIEHSETFKSKTEFSQQKYLKKKRKKHVFIFTVLKPTARLLVEMMYSKSPEKIRNLRADSLSQILTHGNVMAGSTVAVVDSCQGLVAGSVMEKMGGFGKVIQFYPGSQLNRHVVDYFDFPKEFMDNLYSFPLNKLASLESRALNPCEEDSSKCDKKTESKLTLDKNGCGDKNVMCSQNSKEIISTETSVSCDPVSCNLLTEKAESPAREKDEAMVSQEGNTSGRCGKRTHDSNPEKWAEKEEREKRRAKQLEDTRMLLLERNIDCLIVACNHHPTPIVLSLLEYMAPSRPVVVQSPHMEPLMDCYTAVKESHQALKLKLSETWYREYQVLPSRTHPTMQMTGTGGYLLTFIRVSKP